MRHGHCVVIWASTVCQFHHCGGLDAQVQIAVFLFIMISQKEMLGIIRTEAIEGGPTDHHFGQLCSPEPERRTSKSEGPTVNYDLRLVRDKDGTLHWEDR